MVISEKHKYIFIEVAKTASTSLKRFLLENDESAVTNEVLNANGERVKVHVHVSAEKLRNIMGSGYKDYKKIGFVRDPFSKIVSSYHFYKNGRAFQNYDKKRKSIKIKIALTKIFPFCVWALVYPYKPNWHFISHSNNIIVDYIGRFSHLEEDFFSIFEDLGLYFENKKLPSFNVSLHKDETQYYGRLLKYLVKLRVKKDISLLKHRNKQLGCRTIYGSRFYPEI